MQDRTVSAMAEIREMKKVDAGRLIENQVDNLVGSFTNIIAMIGNLHGEEAAEDMGARLLAAIKAQDADKFRRAFRNMEGGKLAR